MRGEGRGIFWAGERKAGGFVGFGPVVFLLSWVSEKKMGERKMACGLGKLTDGPDCLASFRQ